MQARKRFFRTLQTIVAILPDRYADSAWAACQTPYLCTSISYRCGTKVSKFRAKNLPFGKPRFGKQSNTSIKQKLLLRLRPTVFLKPISFTKVLPKDNHPLFPWQGHLQEALPHDPPSSTQYLRKVCERFVNQQGLSLV